MATKPKVWLLIVGPTKEQRTCAELAAVVSSGSMDDERSSVDSIRTVEFSRMLRGYDCDEVDDFLDRVANEVEELKSRFQRTEDELRQAKERADIVGATRSVEGEPASSEAVQRMLSIAERFVEHTKSEAEHESEEVLAEARDRAQRMVAEAEERAARLKDQTERRRVEEVSRLESIKTQLQADIESLMQHMESERERLKAAMSELLGLVDEKMRPISPRRQSPPAAQTSRGAPSRQVRPAVADGEPIPGLDREPSALADGAAGDLQVPDGLAGDGISEVERSRPSGARPRSASSPD